MSRCGATLTAVRAADAVEAIAVEVFRQAESSGQLVTMSLINRALEQLKGIGRRAGAGSAARWWRKRVPTCVSDGVGVAAVGERDPGAGTALSPSQEP